MLQFSTIQHNASFAKPQKQIARAVPLYSSLHSSQPWQVLQQPPQQAGSGYKLAEAIQAKVLHFSPRFGDNSKEAAKPMFPLVIAEIENLQEGNKGKTLPVLLAALYAAKIHKHQTRKGDSPFIGRTPVLYHLMSVASRMAQCGGSTEGIVAALLHDSIEDTKLNEKKLKDILGQIADESGKHIANKDAFIQKTTAIVLGCTEPDNLLWKSSDKEPHPHKQARKQGYLEVLHQVPIDALKDVLLIRAVDKLDNMESDIRKLRYDQAYNQQIDPTYKMAEQEAQHYITDLSGNTRFYQAVYDSIANFAQQLTPQNDYTAADQAQLQVVLGQFHDTYQSFVKLSRKVVRMLQNQYPGLAFTHNYQFTAVQPSST